ncbi:MAG: HNH endonuclease [Limisphaerales bacterium]
MPSVTTAYTKNIVRRAFREIIDETPSKQEVDKIWKFFDSECAYCGKKLQKTNKEGHIDHLVSASKGGRNHVSNRVLSCANCNEKEKLDSPWEEFLASKVSDPPVLESRRQRISDWQRQNSCETDKIFQNLADSADSLANKVVKCFDLEIAELKRQKQNLEISK